MSKYKFNRRIISSSAITALLVIFNVQKVYACTSTPPTPWFIPSVSLISSNLPDTAAEIRPVDNSLSVKNTSETIIQIIVSGTSQNKNDYYELSAGQSAQIQVNNNDDLILSSANGEYYYSIASLDRRNIVADNRPTDVKVPSPQSVTVHLTMNGQPYLIQLQISYALNPDYQPVTILALDSSCANPLSIFFAEFNLPITGFICVSSLVLVVGIIVFVKLRKRKSNIESNLNNN